MFHILKGNTSQLLKQRSKTLRLIFFERMINSDWVLSKFVKKDKLSAQPMEEKAISMYLEKVVGQES